VIPLHWGLCWFKAQIAQKLRRGIFPTPGPVRCFRGVEPARGRDQKRFSVILLGIWEIQHAAQISHLNVGLRSQIDP